MTSPYPLHYTLRWPFYYWRPSRKNHSNIPLTPIAHTFIANQNTDYKRLLFCGDIMITQRDCIPQLAPELCELINSADLLIGNCEAPVGKQELNSHAKYRMRFNMPQDFLTGIMNQLSIPANKWVLSVANNHSGDQGEQALLDTYHLLNNLHITPVGLFEDKHTPLSIVECGELRIGVAAWTQWMNCEVFPANPGVYRLNHITETDITRLKQEYKLDLLLGLPHWEYEFQHFPRKDTRILAKELINKLGFNIITGAHPHTLMPMEWFENGICQYSLGNFCGLGSAWPVKLIPILEVRVSTTHEHKGKIISYELHPFVQLPTRNKIDIIPLTKAPKKLKNKIMNRLNILTKFHIQDFQ